MKRRSVLTALGAAVTGSVAGCVTSSEPGGPGPERVGVRFDDPQRPECETGGETIEIEGPDGEPREHETAATVPYPEPPAAFDRDTVIAYVEAFEGAYVTHDVLCDESRSGHVLNVAHSVQDRKSFDWYEGVTVVYLLQAAGATSGVDENGLHWEADLGFTGVVYAVDETGVARSDFPEAPGVPAEDVEAEAPDPMEDGQFVASFE